MNYLVALGGGLSSTILYVSYDDSIVVTSATSKTLAGTFHGMADYHYFDMNSTSFKDSLISITDGTFNVKF